MYDKETYNHSIIREIYCLKHFSIHDIHFIGIHNSCTSFKNIKKDQLIEYTRYFD